MVVLKLFTVLKHRIVLNFTIMRNFTIAYNITIFVVVYTTCSSLGLLLSHRVRSDLYEGSIL